MLLFRTYCIFGFIAVHSPAKIHSFGYYMNAVVFTFFASCSVVASNQSVWLQANSSLTAKAELVGRPESGHVVISAAFGGGDDPSLP